MGRRTQLGQAVRSQWRSDVTDRPVITHGLLSQMRSQAQQLLSPSGPCPAISSCMPGTWPPKGSHGVFCIRRHTLPEADREKLPCCLRVLGCSWREGLHPLRNLPGMCVGLGCAREVPAVADNAPSLASLPTTPNTPYPRDVHAESTELG